jgi:hypothetical protein
VTPECRTTGGSFYPSHDGAPQDTPRPPDDRRWRLCGVAQRFRDDGGGTGSLTFFWQLDEREDTSEVLRKVGELMDLAKLSERALEHGSLADINHYRSAFERAREEFEARLRAQYTPGPVGSSLPISEARGANGPGKPA